MHRNRSPKMSIVEALKERNAICRSEQTEEQKLSQIRALFAQLNEQ